MIQASLGVGKLIPPGLRLDASSAAASVASTLLASPSTLACIIGTGASVGLRTKAWADARASTTKDYLDAARPSTTQFEGEGAASQVMDTSCMALLHAFDECDPHNLCSSDAHPSLQDPSELKSVISVFHPINLLGILARRFVLFPSASGSHTPTMESCALPLREHCGAPACTQLS